MVRGLVIAALLLGPAVASGDDRPIYGPGDAPEFGFVGDMRADGLILARQVIPAQNTPTVSNDRTAAAVAQSRIVYLNKNGVTLTPGTNDARINRSTVVSASTAIVGWSANATTWNETVTCMRELFSRFDITIVDQDPGNVPHIEAVFGGTPQQVGLDSSVAGVSPFTTDCSIIEYSVVFTFTNAFSFTSREACEIMAQEVAHSYGLDHELLASDPMTYLDYTGNRSFQDTSAQCGESSSAPRQCGINGNVCRANQNSVALLTERVGLADAIMPTIATLSPANNSTVPPGFQVKISGNDNKIVTGAVLKIDGVQRDMISGAGPFAFTTPSLPEGSHTFTVEVSDGHNVKTEMRTVTVMIGAPPPPDDDGIGEYGEVAGGCSTGRNQSSGLVIALGLLLASRRRRRHATTAA
jgi:MYXO-CTERM domain-containing protein